MKTLRTTLVGLVLGFAVGTRADEPSAPLQSVKQELQSLQKDETAAKAGGMSNDLKDGLPQFQGPTPGAIPLEMPTAKTPQSELKKKRDAQKNWLLDGVGRLDDEAKAKANGTDRSGRDKSEKDDESLDPTDSDYLLKLYADQKKKDTGSKEARAGDKKNDVLAQNDPMAPFLQDWLADSPVRGKFFDEFLKNPNSRPAESSLREGPAGPVDPLSSGGLTITDPSGGRAPEAPRNSAPKPNPYLEALASGEAKSASIPTSVPDSFSRVLESKPAPSPVEQPPAPRTGDRKAPPSPFKSDGFFPNKKNF